MQPQNELTFPERPVLLDGGMGRELRFRGVPITATIWSANALLVAPDVIRQVHADYIAAGADIITTNTYGIIRDDLAKEGLEDRFAEFNTLAGKLACDARDAADRPALIAGSLPPLRGSYRPDLVGPFDDIVPRYREQAELLAPYVDLFLCETMSSAAEGKAAATAACATGKPVWVAWTLLDDHQGILRSREGIDEAIAALDGLPVSGFLLNCCAAESVTAGMPPLAAAAPSGASIGGYANTFQPIPKDWRLDGDKATDGLLTVRTDLDPDQYADHAAQWLHDDATVIGGCCGTRPAHIAKLRERFQTIRKDYAQ